ncbi:hypothetical protein ACOSQ3_026588 [Xanthoceras sorbifolium]
MSSIFFSIFHYFNVLRFEVSVIRECVSESPSPGDSKATESKHAHDFERSLHSESSLPPGIIRGYNSEDYYRGKLQFDRFAINHVLNNLINHSKLVLYKEEFSIPLEVGLRLQKKEERATDPEPGSAAIHPAFLELGVRLPLRRFLRDIGLAPTQISPNG